MKSRRFIEFYRGPNETDRILGSDGYMVADGRWGFDRIHNEALLYRDRLLKVRNDITHYRIISGELLSTARHITKIIKL